MESILPYFTKITFGLLAICTIACTQKAYLPDPVEAGWNGEPVCKVIRENANLRALQCTFPPGVGHEKHKHAAHFGYTLKGGKFRIEDASGTREVDVPTGYDFYNNGIDWHQVLNIGDSTAVFLIVEPK